MLLESQLIVSEGQRPPEQMGGKGRLLPFSTVGTQASGKRGAGAMETNEDSFFLS